MNNRLTKIVEKNLYEHIEFYKNNKYEYYGPYITFHLNGNKFSEGYNVNNMWIGLWKYCDDYMLNIVDTNKYEMRHGLKVELEYEE